MLVEEWHSSARGPNAATDASDVASHTCPEVTSSKFMLGLNRMPQFLAEHEVDWSSGVMS
jgi:hypothetical protein